MPSYKDLVTELPYGQMVCRAHGLVVCGRCCVDFSFTQDDEADADSGYQERSSHTNIGASGQALTTLYGPRTSAALSTLLNDGNLTQGERPDRLSIRRCTGRIFPTAFVPPPTASTPQELFPPTVSRRRARPHVLRFLHRDDLGQMLIYTDGACLNNGQANPKAGWAFVFRPTDDQIRGDVSARLENKGPFGDLSSQTNNRAELRAVLAALRFRDWKGEGCETIVIATDSEYVAKGATQWARTWLRNGWRTSSGAVMNKDLWEMLLGEVERWDFCGVKVQFWRIPRAFNEMADSAAKQAAKGTETYDAYQEFREIPVSVGYVGYARLA